MLGWLVGLERLDFGVSGKWFGDVLLRKVFFVGYPKVVVPPEKGGDLF